MPTWQQLRDVKLNEYTDAADGWGKVSARSNADKDRVDNEMLARIRKSQTGKAAEAAEADLDQLSRNYQYLHTECGLVRTALNGLATELAAPQKKLKQALEDAENLKFTVHADGSVEYPAGGENLIDKKPIPGGTANGSQFGLFSPTGPPLYQGQGNSPLLNPPGLYPGLGGGNPNQAKAQAVANAIAAAVREANEIDGRYSGVLRHLKADPGLKVEYKDLADAAADTKRLQDAAGKYVAASDIPQGKSTEENAKWWNGLTQEQRDEYATLFPASVGALDGIPSTVRDDANRMVFAESRAKYEIELAGIPPEPKPKLVSYGARGGMVYSQEWLDWHHKYEGRQADLKGWLHGMDAIESRLERPAGSGMPEAYLLKFNAEKDDGRVILANGNPDTADHTAVYVPGTKTKLSDIEGDLSRTDRLWSTSHALDPEAKFSTITWFDYNAPNDIPAATLNKYGEEGAPTLRQFMNGMETAQGGPDKSHTTVMGHSYGSTVAGMATQQGQSAGPLADDIIAVGSPGMQVKHASDLGVGKEHVWAMGGDGDDILVRQGGRLVGHGEGFTIPTDKGFGGNIMQSDAKDHGDFWEPGRNSLNNQAAVIAGQYDKVRLD
ncbi:alpha/beta hydrolase [Streptomyces sp. NPDC015346]|uniref:alpha/beta hydrolase n=1 Tax=Streptomyces sp. NPDC015346 TaxID=3364954 RepID=UPI0036FEEEFB